MSRGYSDSARANLFISSWLNASRSSGLRLVTRSKPMAEQSRTCSSRQTPPALLMSVSRLGQLVSDLAATTPASISVHGPWQIAAIGGPAAGHGLDERDCLRYQAQLVGIGDAAGQHQRREVLGQDIADRVIGIKGAGRLGVVADGLHRLLLRREQHRLAAGLPHGLPGARQRPPPAPPLWDPG